MHNTATSYRKKATQKFVSPKYRKVIEENMENENFGIPQLCRAMGYSRSQLHNKIKAQTGISTSIYVRNIRLRKAKILLQNSDLNISEIAYEVGFKDPSYFSKLYAAKYGFAPRRDRGKQLGYFA